MQWDEFFRDLEGQLGDERAAEQAVHQQEQERLRVARLDLATRLRSAAHDHPVAQLSLIGGHSVRGLLVATGADWCAIKASEPETLEFVPLAAILSLALADVRRSLMTTPELSLAHRVRFGFVMRDLARRRSSVTLRLGAETTSRGTIDRAGADHLDFAHHEAGTPRRAAAVRQISLVPFAALAAVSVASTRAPAFMS